MAKSNGASTALTVVRVFQIITLVICWAILAALVHEFNSAGHVAPAGVLTLFIVALLASIWAFCVVITQARARNTAYWMTAGDIIVLAGLIAGVILISDITSKCDTPQNQVVYATSEDGTRLYPVQTVAVGNDAVDPVWRDDNNCGLAKAAMGLGIANIILFLISAILATVVVIQNRQEDEELVREKVYTTGVRRRSRSRNGSVGYVERTERSGSRRHRSRHSHGHRSRHESPMEEEYIIEERIV